MAKPPGPIPSAVAEAWAAFGDPRRIVSAVDISATVSTNVVYMVQLSDGHELIAKTTLYGSYVHFRQDHRIVAQWIRRLQDTRYRNFLAPVCDTLGPDGIRDVFTHRAGRTWVVFYEKAKFYDFLPKVLDAAQVTAFGREMAEFHKISTRVAPQLSSSWKSVGSDVAILYDVLGDSSWRDEHHLHNAAEAPLKAQCDLFLTNAERIGYHHFQKIPVLVDWNIGNFSVGFDQEGFKMYSRWDYDWFRVEPRALDFYFCARVVRADGDQDNFSYTVAPFFEERFFQFLRAYHAVYPLEDEELLFFKEAYRFFLLNYVIRIGEFFFKPQICQRLQREALETYFPELDRCSFTPLVEALG